MCEQFKMEKTLPLLIDFVVDKYMKQTRTIILAVMPANVDVHNSEIIQAAARLTKMEIALSVLLQNRI